MPVLCLSFIPWPTSTAYIILSLKVLVLEVTVPLDVVVLGTGGPVNAPGPAGTLARWLVIHRRTRPSSLLPDWHCSLLLAWMERWWEVCWMRLVYYTPHSPSLYTNTGLSSCSMHQSLWLFSKCGGKSLYPNIQYYLGTRKFMIASQSCGHEFYRVLYHFSTTLD